jgi:hypothetical protein
MTHHGWVEPLLGLVTGDEWLMAAVEFSRNMDDTLSLTSLLATMLPLILGSSEAYAGSLEY